MRSVSIIILTYNSERTIDDCIESVMKLNYPKDEMEVIVVDGGSTDKTLDILKEYPVKIIKHKKKGFASSRNIGLHSAKGEIIVFTDSDCIVDVNWLKELLRCFNSHIGAVGGPCLPPKTNTFGYCVSALGYPGGGLASVFNKFNETKELSTCNFAMRREILNEIGYFDESFVYGGEDTDFVRRIQKKYKLFFNPKAIVYHRPRERLVDFIKWWIRRGKGDVELHKKYLPAFPRSLFSPRVSKFQHLIFIISGFFIISRLNFWIFLISLILFFAYKFIRIYKQQKTFNKFKKYLPIQEVHYWIIIPFLGWLLWVIRDIGRIIGYIEYLKKSFLRNH
jgi:cellulose synthase/poly-beta-1,6-N-acetylglucosamine synthase-like glycosyltransferase